MKISGRKPLAVKEPASVVFESARALDNIEFHVAGNQRNKFTRTGMDRASGALVALRVVRMVGRASTLADHIACGFRTV